MKQVSQKKYDSSYYENNYEFNYDRKISHKDFGDIPTRMGDLLSLKSTDKVVDFGCGAGSLCFYLLLRYNCFVTGIDYSADAISVSKKNKKRFLVHNKKDEKKISFLQKDVRSLPDMSSVKVVYLQDVIEHMYDHEIKVMLEKFKLWNQKEIYLALHTDNNIYLQWVQPVIDFISVLLGKTTWKEIEKRKKYDAERHINLMSVRQLKNKLLQEGFTTIKVEYSTVSHQKIAWQLGKAAKVKLFLYTIYFFANMLVFLRPSFFLLAKYTTHE